jgi:hypothetical protein
MTELYYKLILSQPEKPTDFVSYLFTFGIFNFEMDVDKGKIMFHNLLYYFWMPLNEILFFIVGILLISLFQKVKKRIDIILLLLIVSFYLGKILLYLVYLQPTKKVYPTIYYHLSGYGQWMINPLFNLSYFFIGMFFGLLNYMVQKGVVDLHKINIYDLIINPTDLITEKLNGLNDNISKEQDNLNTSVDNLMLKNRIMGNERLNSSQIKEKERNIDLRPRLKKTI